MPLTCACSCAKDIRHTVARRGNLVVVRFADAAMHDKAGDVLNNRFPRAELGLGFG